MLCIKIKIKIQTFIGVRIVQFLHYSFYGGLYVLLRLFVQSQFVVEIHLCISPFRAHLYQILLARYMLGGNWKTVSMERLLTPTFYLTVVSHIQILEQQSWPFLNKNAVFFISFRYLQKLVNLHIQIAFRYQDINRVYWKNSSNFDGKEAMITNN